MRLKSVISHGSKNFYLIIIVLQVDKRHVIQGDSHFITQIAAKRKLFVAMFSISEYNFNATI